MHEGLLRYGRPVVADVEDGNGTGEVLAIERGELAIAGVDDGAGNRLRQAPRGDAVVQHQGAGDFDAVDLEDEAVGLLDERRIGLETGFEACCGELDDQRLEAGVDVVRSDQAVRVRGKLGVESGVDGVRGRGVRSLGGVRRQSLRRTGDGLGEDEACGGDKKGEEAERMDHGVDVLTEDGRRRLRPPSAFGP